MPGNSDAMQDLGEFLQRLGRRMERMDRRFGWEGRFGDHEDNGDQMGETVERELVFGEEPELYLAAGLLSVELLPVAAGEAPRIVLTGRQAHASQIEIGTRDNGAVTVDVHPHYGWHTVDFRPWRARSGHLHLTVFLPAGVRVHGRVDAGRLSAANLQAAELDLRTDAGKLALERCTGRMRLASSAGKLTIDDCSGVIEAHTDAGSITAENLHLEGGSSLHANAGSIRCGRVHFLTGEHTVETSLGSVRLGLAPDAPVRIETSATLGSISNSAGNGPADAPATLRVRTELGSIKIRFDEAPATPLRHVPLTDARPLTRPPVYRTEEEVAIETDPPRAAAPAASEEETLRILGMVERHEITAGEAAALLTALRGGR